MFGGEANKPSTGDEKFGGLQPGKYSVTMDDMNTGVSDKTGKQYWIMKFTDQSGQTFDHFMPCEETEYKTEEKVYNTIARQADALMIYDAIGEHKTLEAYVQKAIDVFYQLKGKKMEFTIKKWKMEDKEGVWGDITGYLDIPNEAIQKTNVSTTAGAPAVDANEEIPF